MNPFKIGEIFKDDVNFEVLHDLGLIKIYGRRCDICNNILCLESKGKGHLKSLKCCNAACRKWISPFSGTIFEKSKIRPGTLMKLIWCYCSRATLCNTASDCGLGLKSVSKWFKFLDNIILEYRSDQNRKIGGLGHIVEIDETHLFKNKRRIGRRNVGESYWVVGGLDRNTGRYFLEVTTRRNRSNLHDIIRENVEVGTKVITDEWRGYWGLEDIGFIHCRINHSVSFVDNEDPIIHTNTIERLWRSLKEFMPTRVNTTNISTWIERFKNAYRANNGTRDSMWNLILAAIKNKYRLN
ncbi:hypothetical protein DMUE_6051 [Dictyocoela muelleri]|nr:hypothetical protein DMUE_6051 [Dictyocoela muelleri]